LVQHASRSELWLLTVFSFFLAVLPGFLGLFRAEAPGAPIAPLMFLPYIGYFLLGYLIRGQGLDAKPIGWAAVGFFAFSGCIIVSTRAFAGDAETGSVSLYLQNYLSPTVIGMSICAFLWISRSGAVRRWSGRAPGTGSFLERHLAPASLGVYLLHPIVLDLLDAAGINNSTQGVFVGLPATLVLVVVLSFLVVTLIRKIRVMRWVVG